MSAEAPELRLDQRPLWNYIYGSTYDRKQSKVAIPAQEPIMYRQRDYFVYDTSRAGKDESQ